MKACLPFTAFKQSWPSAKHSVKRRPSFLWFEVSVCSHIARDHRGSLAPIFAFCLCEVNDGPVVPEYDPGLRKLQIGGNGYKGCQVSTLLMVMSYASHVYLPSFLLAPCVRPVPFQTFMSTYPHPYPSWNLHMPYTSHCEQSSHRKFQEVLLPIYASHQHSARGPSLNWKILLWDTESEWTPERC